MRFEVTKEIWTTMVGSVLFFDGRSGVEECTYRKTDDGEEVVEVRYDNGNVAKINVTANSLGAIFREIAAEVYGSGAVGTFYRGKGDTLKDNDPRAEVAGIAFHDNAGGKSSFDITYKDGYTYRTEMEADSMTAAIIKTFMAGKEEVNA